MGAPACGDVMKLQIEVDDAGLIIDAKFKTFGCGSAIASSSLMTELVKGKSLNQAMEIRNSEIANELCLPPVKMHCSSIYSLLSVQCLPKTPSKLLCETFAPSNRFLHKNFSVFSGIGTNL